MSYCSDYSDYDYIPQEEAPTVNPFDVEELTQEKIIEILNKTLFNTPSDLKLSKFYGYELDEREIIVKYCNPA